MLIIVEKKLKEKKATLILPLNFSIGLGKKVAFQIFFDLCLLRKWDSVRIFSLGKNSEYGILGKNPTNGENEIFIPFLSETRINLSKIENFGKFIFFLHKKKTFQIINFAFIDTDSTISYYRLNFSLHMSSGPFFKGLIKNS